MIAGLAWARSSLSVMFGDVPLADVLILLVGLPLIAAAGGWLFAGREAAGSSPGSQWSEACPRAQLTSQQPSYAVQFDAPPALIALSKIWSWYAGPATPNSPAAPP